MPILAWPVKKSTRITRGFASENSHHQGLDIAAPLSTAIYAAHDGWVTYAGNEFHGYGNLLVIETSKGWSTFYGHCKKLLVKQGAYVKQGKKIALMGKTGDATGVHLHFEVRQNSQPVDPLPLFRTH